DRAFHQRVARGTANATGAAQSMPYSYKPNKTGSFNWRARAIIAGVAGEPSAARRLEVVPETPIVVAPAAGTEISSNGAKAVRVEWKSAAGAARYRVETRFAGLPPAKQEESRDNFVVLHDVPVGQHRVVVTALDGGGRESGPSEERSFRVLEP